MSMKSFTIAVILAVFFAAYGYAAPQGKQLNFANFIKILCKTELTEFH